MTSSANLGKSIAHFAAITLLLVSSLIGFSSAAALAEPVQYGPQVRVSPQIIPGNVSEIGVVDLNGDGLEDIIAGAFYYPGVQSPIPIIILLNDGHGGFSDGTSQVIEGPVPTVNNPRKIVIADFNGDGKPDIFIGDQGPDYAPFPGGQNRLLLSTPDGHYVDASANLPQELGFTHSADAADIDGSGHKAIYVSNIYSQAGTPPRLLLNDGTGHFTIATGRIPPAILDLSKNKFTAARFVDVNGDGCPDLVLGTEGDPGTPTTSQVLLNDCTGHFTILPNAIPPLLFSDGIVVDIKPVKLGTSGKPDLLLSMTHNSPSYTGRAVQVLINNGDGTFHDESSRLPINQSSGTWARYVHLFDSTGSCQLDVYPELDQAPPLVQLFVNDGKGNFTGNDPRNPSTRLHAVPIDLTGNGIKSFISNDGGGFFITPGTALQPCVTNLSAILPASRTVQVGATATAFMTVLNLANVPAFDCSLGIAGAPVGRFTYQATDPHTNALVGHPNPTLDIPANGMQTYVFALTPAAAVAATDVSLAVKCANHGAVPHIAGVNTLTFAATLNPTPDMVALALTTSNDGILAIPAVGAAGAFSVASINLGTTAQVQVSADTGGGTLPIAITLCQTNPASGVCLVAPAALVSTTVAAGATPTFAVFAQANQAVPLDAAHNRIFLRFKDINGALVGATSVAVRTP
jgi:hypothetical protein